jgi:hypothetical protein
MITTNIVDRCTLQECRDRLLDAASPTAVALAARTESLSPRMRGSTVSAVCELASNVVLVSTKGSSNLPVA